MTTLIATRPPTTASRTTTPIRTRPVALRRPTQTFQWDLRIDEAPCDVQDIEAALVGTSATPSAAARIGEELPNVENWARALTRGIMEVLLGIRPVGQLRRWVVYPLFKRLEKCRQPWTGTAPHCWVRSVHSVQISSSTVELALTVSIDQHIVAVAMRLEACRYHWLATALDIV